MKSERRGVEGVRLITGAGVFLALALPFAAGAGSVWEDVKKDSGSAWSDLKKGSADYWEAIKQGGKDAWSGTKEAGAEAWEETKQTSGEIRDGVTGGDEDSGEEKEKKEESK